MLTGQNTALGTVEIQSELNQEGEYSRGTSIRLLEALDKILVDLLLCKVFRSFEDSHRVVETERQIAKVFSTAPLFSLQNNFEQF